MWYKRGVVKDLCRRDYKTTILFAFLNIVAFFTRQCCMNEAFVASHSCTAENLLGKGFAIAAW